MMKAVTSLFLALIFIVVPFAGLVNAMDEVPNYCYKPSKPLFFATAMSNKRYKEDLQEYQHCQKHYAEMRVHEAELKKEAERNSQVIFETFMDNSH